MINCNIPAVFLYLKIDNKILLGKRKNTSHGNGLYSLVAGHVEEKETYKQACIREAKEEANIEVSDLELIHTAHKICKNEKDRTHLFFYANSYKGELKNVEPDKCDALEWFDINNLPHNMVKDVKEIILLIEKGINYSEYYE
jgi:ADP-ribose pyrophosphatase YjhB (NUDIX family)